VLALARGAAPEVVEHGVSGFVEQTVDGLVGAVGRIGHLDRERCRQRVEQYYSGRAITDGYERVYSEMMQAAGAHRPQPAAA
jgi:glycosyltransferase involved in cell wall biosynthesis